MKMCHIQQNRKTVFDSWKIKKINAKLAPQPFIVLWIKIKCYLINFITFLKTEFFFSISLKSKYPGHLQCFHTKVHVVLPYSWQRIPDKGGKVFTSLPNRTIRGSNSFRFSVWNICFARSKSYVWRRKVRCSWLEWKPTNVHYYLLLCMIQDTLQ